MARSRNLFRVGDMVKFDYEQFKSNPPDWVTKRLAARHESDIGMVVRVVQHIGIVKIYEVLWFGDNTKEKLSSTFIAKIS